MFKWSLSDYIAIQDTFHIHEGKADQNVVTPKDALILVAKTVGFFHTAPHSTGMDSLHSRSSSNSMHLRICVEPEHEIPCKRQFLGAKKHPVTSLAQDGLYNHSSTQFVLAPEPHQWLTNGKFPKLALTASVTFHSSRTMTLDREDTHAVYSDTQLLASMILSDAFTSCPVF